MLLNVLALDSTHVVSNTTIRIVTKGASKIALQFERSQSLDLLVGNYEVNNVSVSKDAGLNNPSSYHMFHQKKGGFPDVNDPAGLCSPILFSAYCFDCTVFGTDLA